MVVEGKRGRRDCPQAAFFVQWIRPDWRRGAGCAARVAGLLEGQADVDILMAIYI